MAGLKSLTGSVVFSVSAGALPFSCSKMHPGKWLGIAHYSQKTLLSTRVFDHPGAPSGHLGVAFHHTKVLLDSEGTACSSGRFATEGHMSC